MTLTRRTFLGGGLGAAASLALGGRARAQGDALVEPPMPAIYVAHGGPSLATSRRRGDVLAGWGRSLPRPRGIVTMTPHVRSVGVALGAVGRGHALMSFPRRFASSRVLEMDYPSPPNDELAARVEELLTGRRAVTRGEQRGLDHTSWMPLSHLAPEAHAPVLELAMPFASDRELFELGGDLAPLRREGVLIVASGNLTHNLAAMGGSDTAPWARNFDAWVARRLADGDVEALVAWRRAAPRAYVAHPDDGGHYDVLLFALGAAVGGGDAPEASFPHTGFEGSLSERCVELA